MGKAAKGCLIGLLIIEWMFPLHLSLNLFAVNPVYVCFSPPSSVIVALYITSLSRHLPCTGQFSFSSQLHVFSSFFSVGSKSLELLAEMAAPMIRRVQISSHNSMECLNITLWLVAVEAAKSD